MDRAAQTIRLLIAGAVGSSAALSEQLAGADGLQVVGASEGPEQAVELAGLRRPDVVLLDFDMPAGGSYRVATDIRDTLPGVRIVALSADDLGKDAAGEEIARIVRSAFLF